MERTISLNIRGVGNWTRELIKRCEGDGKGLTFFVQVFVLNFLFNSNLPIAVWGVPKK